MADFKGRKRGKSYVQNMGIFLVAQDMVLSHRAKFQLIINFFRVKAISTGLKDAIARTYRKKRLIYAVSAPGHLRGKSGEGEFILYSILQKHLF